MVAECSGLSEPMAAAVLERLTTPGLALRIGAMADCLPADGAGAGVRAGSSVSASCRPGA